MSKIVVCTVTYNSSKLLEKTIQAVLSQSEPVDHIVIADNNSAKEHRDRLREYEKLSKKITILYLEKNTGGAGGFSAAMKYARDIYDPDWYWLMDDDAYPEEACLEKLLVKSRELDQIGFLAPVIYGIDNEKYQLYHARVRRGFIYKFNSISDSFDSLKEVENIDVDAFVGPLIPREAVKECGLPRAEYFIEGDDTDYCFRLSQKYKGYLIKTAIMYHKDLAEVNGINPGGWWKQYYWFRNSILFAHYNLKGFHKWISILHFLAFALKQKWKMGKDPRYDGYREFRWNILRKGLMDGVRKKGGPLLLPADYRTKLELWEKEMRSKND